MDPSQWDSGPRGGGAAVRGGEGKEECGRLAHLEGWRGQDGCGAWGAGKIGGTGNSPGGGACGERQGETWKAAVRGGKGVGIAQVGPCPCASHTCPVRRTGSRAGQGGGGSCPDPGTGPQVDHGLQAAPPLGTPAFPSSLADGTRRPPPPQATGASITGRLPGPKFLPGRLAAHSSAPPGGPAPEMCLGGRHRPSRGQAAWNIPCLAPRHRHPCLVTDPGACHQPEAHQRRMRPCWVGGTARVRRVLLRTPEKFSRLQ